MLHARQPRRPVRLASVHKPVDPMFTSGCAVVLTSIFAGDQFV